MEQALRRTERHPDRESGRRPVRRHRPGGCRDIALSSAGVSQSQVYELEVEDELDEDQPCYKVEFKTGGYDYEYEIDAFTGAVLKSERDRDD